MPGMVFLKRRWAIATDDFLWIGLIDTAFYSVCLGWTVSSVYNCFDESCSCDGTSWCTLLRVFLIGSCCKFFLSTIISMAFIFFSSRGTIAQPGLRAHVPRIVLGKAILSLYYLCGAIIGSVLLAHFGEEERDSEACYIVKVVTICLWFVLSVKVFMVWLFYDPRGKQNKSTKLRKTIPNEYLSPPVPYGSSRKWRHRFQAFCFWFTTKSEDRSVAIRTVSEILAFITHNVDLVASDLIAGMMLYRRRCLKAHQHEMEQFQSLPKISLPDGTAVQRFPTADMPPWMNLKLAQHYFTIGMGIFGWYWTVYRNIWCGLCLLCKKCTLCFPCKSQSQIVEGDNCCGCDFAGLQQISGVEYKDLIHVCFVNRVYQIPFFVTLDHSTSSVVVTARGSMSCADALTDVSTSFQVMDESSCPSGTLCHGGVLMAARRMKEKLEDRKILEKAFEGRTHYRLVITGHSLGAGIATLLTLMYKSIYEDVKCFAFAPPPVLNEIALPETLDCVFTVIYGNDVVPFLNYWNIRNMVVDIVSLLKECQLAKHKVFMGCPEENIESKLLRRASTCDVEEDALKKDATSEIKQNIENGCSNEIQKEQDLNVDVEEGSTTSDVIGEVEKDDDLKVVCDKEGNCNGSATRPDSQTRFYPAGRILAIKHSKKYGYRLRICNPKEFQPLLCKRHMVNHHLPQYLEVPLKVLGQTEQLDSDHINNEIDSAANNIDIESAIPSSTPSNTLAS